ncbi:hypothetical protein MRX96_014085 [Rhipicephalus microplus]
MLAGVLADLRSYCQDVAPKTQSEESLSEGAASPSPMQKQPPSEQKALVVDPEFIVDSSPAEEEDEVLVLDASLEARSASPASSLLPDSPRKEHELFFKEAEKRQEGEERLDRRVERREEVEQAATVDSALWQRGGLPGTTASAFLVPWNRPAVRQTGPRLAAPPVSYAPAAAAAPPVSYAPAAAAAPPVSYAPAALYSSSSSFQSGAFRKPDVVTFKDWRKAARLPPPVARPAEDTISWCGDLYSMGTSMTPPPSAFGAVLVRASVVDSAATLLDAGATASTAGATCSSNAASWASAFAASWASAFAASWASAFAASWAAAFAASWAAAFAASWAAAFAATSRGVHHRVLPGGMATAEALFQPDP